MKRLLIALLFVSSVFGATQHRTSVTDAQQGEFLVGDSVNFTGGANNSNIQLPATTIWVISGMHLSVPSGAGGNRTCRFYVTDADQTLYGSGPDGVGYHTIAPGGSLAWTGPIVVAPSWYVGVQCTNDVAPDGTYTWSHWGVAK